MNNEILKKIGQLQQIIETSDISAKAADVKCWGGADVIISQKLDERIKRWLHDQPVVVSIQNTEPRRRAIITDFARELSWLFIKLRDIFGETIDFVSKYDFYGRLAQSAIDFQKEYPESDDPKDLLKAVLHTAETIAITE